MLKILLIGGHGRWGQKYQHTLSSSFPSVEVHIGTRDNWRLKLLDSVKFDGVIICTRPDSHLEIALETLSRNLPTMIEKPLVNSLTEAQQLQPFAKNIFVNHTQLFTSAYISMKKWLGSQGIIQIITNGYGPRLTPGCSGLWDYGWHDLSMILDLKQERPKSIWAYQTNNSLYYLELEFDNCKSQSLVGQHSQSLSARDLTIEHNGITLKYDDKIRPATHAPPLTTAIGAFLAGIREPKLVPSYDSFKLSLQILEVLESADLSIKTKNKISLL